MKYSGKLITFEGGEGAGKTTQIRMLENVLLQRGLRVLKTREPGGTVGGELLRTVLKDQPDTLWDPVCQTLIFYAARKDLLDKKIKPALEQGAWVLSDRFSDSTFVYQGYAQGLGVEFVQTIHTLVLKDFQPNLTFFLDVPPEQGLKRARKRPSMDYFESMDLSFHHKVYEGYQNLIRENPRFVSIPGALSPAKVHDLIVDYVQKKL